MLFQQNLFLGSNNLNNQEWCEFSNDLKVTNIGELCKIAYLTKYDKV